MAVRSQTLCFPLSVCKFTSQLVILLISLFLFLSFFFTDFCISNSPKQLYDYVLITKHVARNKACWLFIIICSIFVSLLYMQNSISECQHVQILSSFYKFFHSPTTEPSIWMNCTCNTMLLNVVHTQKEGSFHISKHAGRGRQLLRADI